MNRAVFFDRDGTLIRERNYLAKIEDVLVYPGTATELARLSAEGFLLFIVSNQSGVGRGYFTLAQAEGVNAHVVDLFAREGVVFSRSYIAPEAPGTPSRGRKPSPQFLLDAQAEFDLSLADSFMVGDKWIDVQCGWNAKVKRSLLVRTGYGAQTEIDHRAEIDRVIVVDDLRRAADWILRNKA